MQQTLSPAQILFQEFVNLDETGRKEFNVMVYAHNLSPKPVGVAARATGRASAIKKGSATAKPAGRQMSAEGRQRIAEATKKRWEEFRANKQKQQAKTRTA